MKEGKLFSLDRNQSDSEQQQHNCRAFIFVYQPKNLSQKRTNPGFEPGAAKAGSPLLWVCGLRLYVLMMQ
jgi:hypothetical protein